MTSNRGLTQSSQSSSCSSRWHRCNSLPRRCRSPADSRRWARRSSRRGRWPPGPSWQRRRGSRWRCRLTVRTGSSKEVNARLSEIDPLGHRRPGCRIAQPLPFLTCLYMAESWEIELPDGSTLKIGADCQNFARPRRHSLPNRCQISPNLETATPISLDSREWSFCSL